MDSLFSILSNKDFDEPPEIASVKKYISDEFKVDASIQLRGNDLIVTVTGASLVNTLRLRGPDMKRRCNLVDRKIIFRIG
ncbi:MAG: hypothetical protein QFB86_04290 [Patescibacteria group bacterium]|nr:hypothetical protein [Patescibacteria group bacterium]